MRVFLTGASGFVGLRFMPRLKALGHDAVGAGDNLDIRDLSQLEAELVRVAPAQAETKLLFNVFLPRKHAFMTGIFQPWAERYIFDSQFRNTIIIDILLFL